MSSDCHPLAPPPRTTMTLQQQHLQHYEESCYTANEYYNAVKPLLTGTNIIFTATVVLATVPLWLNDRNFYLICNMKITQLTTATEQYQTVILQILQLKHSSHSLNGWRHIPFINKLHQILFCFIMQLLSPKCYLNCSYCLHYSVATASTIH